MAITRLGGANAISGTLPAANINDTSIGNITALPAAISTGKVLQVVTAAGNTQLNTNSGTYQDLSGMSLNITPSSTSSTILLTHQFSYIYAPSAEAGFGSYVLRTVGGSSTIVQAQSNAQTYINFKGSGQQFQTIWNEQLYDNPSTTSQINYKTQVATYNNLTVRFNFDSIYYGRITAMEIAG